MPDRPFLEGIDKEALIDELQNMGSTLSDSQWHEILGGPIGASDFGDFDADAFIEQMQEMGSALAEEEWWWILGGERGASHYGDFDREAFVDEIQTMGSTLSDVQWSEILEEIPETDPTLVEGPSETTSSED